MTSIDQKIIQCPKDGSITTIHECFECDCCNQIRHGDYRLPENRVECCINHKSIFVTPIDPGDENDRVGNDTI